MYMYMHMYSIHVRTSSHTGQHAQEVCVSVTRDWDPMNDDISEGHAAEAQSSHLWGQGLGTQGEGREGM